MRSILVFFIGLYLGLLVFMPKESLFFTLQKVLSQKNIYINSDIKNSLISLLLKKSVVYYKGMDIAKIKNIKIFPYLLYNFIEVDGVKINFGNYKINNLNFVYSVINPVKLKIYGDSRFGKLEGEANLRKKELKVYVLDLKDSKLKRFLKKDKKGYFYYNTPRIKTKKFLLKCED